MSQLLLRRHHRGTIRRGSGNGLYADRQFQLAHHVVGDSNRTASCQFRIPVGVASDTQPSAGDESLRQSGESVLGVHAQDTLTLDEAH